MKTHTYKYIHIILVLAVLAHCAISLRVATADVYLKGTAPENALWSTADNWTGPTAGDKLFIGTTNATGAANQSAMINSSDTVADLTLGSEASTSGRLQVNDGANLTVNSNLIVGNAGTGSWVQSGGDVSITGNFYAGNLDNATATFDFTGGNFSATKTNNNFFAKASNTNAVMNVSQNANLTLSGFNVANAGGSTGTINLSGGTIKIQSDNLRLGNAHNGAGILNQTGGNFVGASNLYVGDAQGSRGTINLSGGTFTANNTFCLGTRGIAELNISGDGAFVANNTFYITHGDTAGAKGIINQVGGTLTAKNIQFGNGGSGRPQATTALYNLRGGKLTATKLFETDPNGNITSQLNILGTAEAKVGEVAIPTVMTGGTLEVATLSNSVTVYDGKLLGALNADGITRTLTIADGGTVTLQKIDYAGTNVALERPTLQPSTYTGYPSSYAVDGIINNNNFAHTAYTSGTDQWWQVELDASMPISEVKLFYREDYLHRLVGNGNGYHFELYDGTLESLGTKVWQSEKFMDYTTGGKTISLNTPVDGKVLRLVRDFAEPLNCSGDDLTINLGELQVYTDKIFTPTLEMNIYKNGTHDQIVLQDGANLVVDGAILKLNFEEGMEISPGMSWDLFSIEDDAMVTGNFADIVVPDIGSDLWDFSTMFSDGMARVLANPNSVPEPSTALLLLLSVVSLGVIRYTKR